MNISGKAELALINLALKYELVTSIRINWRENKHDIYIMLDNALNASDSLLNEKASELLNVLPPNIKSEFETFQGPSSKGQTKKVKMYRGVAIPQETDTKESTDEAKDNTTDTPPKKRSWRGVNY